MDSQVQPARRAAHGDAWLRGDGGRCAERARRARCRAQFAHQGDACRPSDLAHEEASANVR